MAPGPAGGGRRKILIRVLGCVTILPLLGAILWLDRNNPNQIGLRFLLVAVAGLSAVEFYSMCLKRNVPVAGIAGTFFLALTFCPAPFLGRLGELPGLVPFLALAGYVLLKLAVRRRAFGVEGAAMTLLGFIYLGMLLLVLIPPVPREVSLWYLVFLILANKGSDMAAFVTGKSMGRHKMAPRLSPNKTWEGAVGGAVGGVATGGAVLLLTPLRDAFEGVPVAALLSFTLLVTMAAQAGDLVESAVKRWAGVKDSGRLLPEFGGMLDMVDSFLVSIPVAHLYALLFLGG